MAAGGCERGVAWEGLRSEETPPRSGSVGGVLAVPGEERGPVFVVVGHGPSGEMGRRGCQVRGVVAARAGRDDPVGVDVDEAVLEEFVAAHEAGGHDVGHQEPLFVGGFAAAFDVRGLIMRVGRVRPHSAQVACG